jgi:hypothetical protein
LPTITSSTSNLSVDEEQAAAATTKKNEDDDATVAQAVAAPVHGEQEALVAVVAAARKTLDEARAREHAAALAGEKNIAHHLEQQLTAAQGIAIP